MIWSLEDANFFGTRPKLPVKREFVGVSPSMTRTKLTLILSGMISAAQRELFEIPRVSRLAARNIARQSIPRDLNVRARGGI